MREVAKSLVYLTDSLTALLQPFSENSLYFCKFIDSIEFGLKCILFFFDFLSIGHGMFKILFLKELIDPRFALVFSNIESEVSFLSAEKIFSLFLFFSDFSFFKLFFA